MKIESKILIESLGWITVDIWRGHSLFANVVYENLGGAPHSTKISQ